MRARRGLCVVSQPGSNKRPCLAMENTVNTMESLMVLQEAKNKLSLAQVAVEVMQNLARVANDQEANFMEREKTLKDREEALNERETRVDSVQTQLVEMRAQILTIAPEVAQNIIDGLLIGLGNDVSVDDELEISEEDAVDAYEKCKDSGIFDEELSAAINSRPDSAIAE